MELFVQLEYNLFHPPFYTLLSFVLCFLHVFFVYSSYSEFPSGLICPDNFHLGLNIVNKDWVCVR